MVQDMLGNEFYVGAYKVTPYFWPSDDDVWANCLEHKIFMLMTLLFFFKDGSVWRTNKFTDVPQFPIADSSADMRVWERRLLYCVPVSYLYSHIIYLFILC